MDTLCFNTCLTVPYVTNHRVSNPHDCGRNSGSGTWDGYLCRMLQHGLAEPRGHVLSYELGLAMKVVLTNGSSMNGTNTSVMQMNRNNTLTMIGRRMAPENSVWSGLPLLFILMFLLTIASINNFVHSSDIFFWSSKSHCSSHISPGWQLFSFFCC